MNPSIHFDGATWRCVLRCCDYAMPSGVTVRSKTSRPVGQQTKNAMVIFDPQTWRPVQIFKMHEEDTVPRHPCPHMGYEDMRIFMTDKGGLQGIAASLHLSRREEDSRTFVEALPQHQPPEQVLLSFDESYDIVAAQPIRGDWGGAQKNWVPFDRCVEPRFLYSIERGTMFDDRGKLHGDTAQVKPSVGASLPTRVLNLAAFSLPAVLTDPLPRTTPSSDREAADLDASDSKPDLKKKKKSSRKPNIRGGDVRSVRGGRIKLDTISSRPTAHPTKTTSRAAAPRGNEDTRMMGSGRVLLPTYEGLRGGSQLLRIADDTWLGIGHEMRWVNHKKFYFHTWYVVNSRGKMTAASAPMKLASEGIEFAAGMAIDGDRVVVSFGVDDMECKLGETSLSAVMGILKSVDR